MNTEYILGICLIKVDAQKTVTFQNAIEKERYKATHKSNTYDIYNNYAKEYLYMCVDLENSFCLTPTKSVTYIEALDIIQKYL